MKHKEMNSLWLRENKILAFPSKLHECYQTLSNANVLISAQFIHGTKIVVQS